MDAEHNGDSAQQRRGLRRLGSPYRYSDEDLQPERWDLLLSDLLPKARDEASVPSNSCAGV